MIETAMKKWPNEQREIQSPSMHSSRTKTFVNFMKNYTNERVFIDLPDNVSYLHRITILKSKKSFLSLKN